MVPVLYQNSNALYQNLNFFYGKSKHFVLKTEFAAKDITLCT